jgi:hypothetical protein
MDTTHTYLPNKYIRDRFGFIVWLTLLIWKKAEVKYIKTKITLRRKKGKLLKNLVRVECYSPDLRRLFEIESNKYLASINMLRSVVNRQTHSH